uniref:CobQ/CobB/MinD/ParA nucleotide binding domain-containing protein n=1 Tax=Candidatus Kentrum sp. UNK TaxID=2126344 RepID=A0A451B5C5_9GAMM|nr:MAG: CobQ/CobB/MinD/ParA nucleotide binding domain-containing protein [Candidatus Kentron sp. UNK]
MNIILPQGKCRRQISESASTVYDGGCAERSTLHPIGPLNFYFRYVNIGNVDSLSTGYYHKCTLVISDQVVTWAQSTLFWITWTSSATILVVIMSDVTNIIDRQSLITEDDNREIEPLPLPLHSRYTVCNLRGGIGKTSLVFNLSYETDNCLAVDTCPQGSLSYFFDNSYFEHSGQSVRDLIMHYILPGFGRASRTARKISATNEFFDGKDSFFISSSNDLFLLPTQIASVISQAKNLSGDIQENQINRVLFSLRDEIDREMEETRTSRCLIDTSPFFSGATHLSWHAVDALIVPVRTDQQSINSLSLLLDTLSNPSSEFRKNMPSNMHSPKIQLVILTHCTWSTAEGARNKANKQTEIYIKKIKELVSRNISHFTTGDPDNHILLLADFLGSGRISAALSKPIARLCDYYESSGEIKRRITINGERVSINKSLKKIRKELSYISRSIWG